MLLCTICSHCLNINLKRQTSKCSRCQAQRRPSTKWKSLCLAADEKELNLPVKIVHGASRLTLRVFVCRRHDAQTCLMENHPALASLTTFNCLSVQCGCVCDPSPRKLTTTQSPFVVLHVITRFLCVHCSSPLGTTKTARRKLRHGLLLFFTTFDHKKTSHFSFLLSTTTVRYTHTQSVGLHNALHTISRTPPTQRKHAASTTTFTMAAACEPPSSLMVAAQSDSNLVNLLL